LFWFNLFLKGWFFKRLVVYIIMTTLQPFETTGPASIPLKQADNNNQTHSLMGMPFKPNTMAQGNMFSMFRKAYIKNSGGGQGFFDASQYTNLKTINATGKSSTNALNSHNNKISSNVMSFSGVDSNSVREGKRYCRSGGSVAPKKKGAYQNNL
jgi:hypothetical protein